MKNIIWLIILIVSVNTFAQDTSFVDIGRYDTKVRTIGKAAITITLTIDFRDEDLEIDDELFMQLLSELNPRLIVIKDNSEMEIEANVEVSVSRKNIEFEITNITEDVLNQIVDNKKIAYIAVDKDIIFEAWKNNDEQTLNLYKVDKSQIKKYTNSNPILTESMAKEYIHTKGGEFYITQNKIDFGIIPSTESSSLKTEFNASFSYRTKYAFLNDKLPVFLKAEGIISSNSNDSLNYISIYPVNYNFFKGTNELVGQLGVESNQAFSSYRISGNFYWNGIIQNLIDLTFGENRLRLKPVLSVGLKLYQEIENNRPLELSSNKFSNQIYSQFYYYIPIKKVYSIIIDGTAFYDFSKKVNPNSKPMFNYSLTFGIDVPKTDFKTIFKFVKGDNFITLESNNYIMIGLLMDLFEQ